LGRYEMLVEKTAGTKAMASTLSRAL